ncbi:hypothetical protein SFC76_03155 [Sphingomonas sp. CD22]|uniref:hypothetical protein n=1 Tax=Sphingomonas sp. CD22 TaxID=3100214 RepID=UPI002ADF6C45|nr:hypothetical protein [Sphingomonas sp. CD22]MEA1083247.1 hypothetical protein [Sphingomonas sp. CD22]
MIGDQHGPNVAAAVEEALGGAFCAGFREGWIVGQSPDGVDRGDLVERYPQAIESEPGTAWADHRDHFLAMLPAAWLSPAAAGEARRIAVQFEASRLGWLNLEAAGGGIVAGKRVTERDAVVAAGVLDWVIGSMLPLLVMGGKNAR